MVRIGKCSPLQKSQFWQILPMARNTGDPLITLLHDFTCGPILPRSHKRKPALGDFPDGADDHCLIQLQIRLPAL